MRSTFAPGKTMPRRRLMLVPGQSVHIIRRGVNRCAVFRDDSDRRLFLSLLRSAAETTHTQIHAFALLDTHYHALATPVDVEHLAKMMHTVGVPYVTYFNRKHERIGTLYTNRYTALPIDSERYVITCLRYIDQNALRAGIVPNLADDRWSTYRAHSGLDVCEWLVEHPLYTALAPTLAQRQMAYRAICGVPLTQEELVVQRNLPRAKPAIIRDVFSVSPST